MKEKKILIALILILSLGFFLRFFELGNVLALHRDEAFLTYNAYSILKTGKDMMENVLPLHLESFLYSPAGYSYFSIPFIAFFGLNVFSARCASALFGLATILLLFILTKQIFAENKEKNTIALLSSLMLSTMPWHINLSRTATENTIVVFFIVLGISIFLRFIKVKKILFLILSFVFFAITFFVYQSPRAFLPFFIIFLGYLFSRGILNKKNIIIFLILYFIVAIIPLVNVLSSKTLSLRLNTVSVFSTQESALVLHESITRDGETKTLPFLTRLYHNKINQYSKTIFDNYVKHFSYEFLFSDLALPERYKIPQIGLLYKIQIPFLFLGIWFLIKKNKQIAIFLIGWLLLGPIGSALTFDDVPNAQRILLVVPAYAIIIAYGYYSFFSLLKENRKIIPFLQIIVILAFMYQFTFYLHQYLIHARVYRPWIRQDGYRELVAKVNDLLPRYKKAIITDRESAPTIFFLFFNSYNPKTFIKEIKNKPMADYGRLNFNKYEFTQEECPGQLKIINNKYIFQGEKGILYAQSGNCRIPLNIHLLATIKRADKSTAFRLLIVADETK